MTTVGAEDRWEEETVTTRRAERSGKVGQDGVTATCRLELDQWESVGDLLEIEWREVREEEVDDLDQIETGVVSDQEERREPKRGSEAIDHFERRVGRVVFVGGDRALGESGRGCELGLGDTASFSPGGEATSERGREGTHREREKTKLPLV